MSDNSTETKAPSGPNISIEPIRSGGYAISRTAPSELLRHDISDEELGRIGEMNRDHLWDFMWVMFGLALGGAPLACGDIYDLLVGTTPMGAKGLAEVVITFMATAVFGVLYLAVYMGKKSRPDLVSEIRERTRQRVS